MTRPFTLPALAMPSGSTPARRRRALLRAGAKALAREQLAPLAESLREGAPRRYRALARFVGLPLGEVLASPFALRLCALAASEGASTAHRELRRLEVAPGGRGATRDPRHGTWWRGRLQLGKYQQFSADEPFATYHPDQSSKWGPHELCHRALRFFWRADMTRWELYLGARLNELVPVTTWYGLEQALRLDDAGRFDRERAGAEPRAELRKARWLRDDLRGPALSGAAIVVSCIEHFERELAAIDEELTSGRRVPVRHALADLRTLDASSDALAYAAHHHAAQTAPRLCEAREDVETAGVDYFDALGAYRDFVEERFDAILFAPITLDLSGAALRARTRREVRDLVVRASSSAGAWRAMRACAASGPGSLGELRERFAGRLGPKAPLFLDAGLSERPETHALDQLAEGLASCAPRALHGAGDDAADLIAGFASSGAILDRAPLGRRFARYLGEGPLADLALLEAMIADAQQGDDEIEVLCEDPAEPPAEGAIVVASEAFEHARFGCDVVALHAGSHEAATGCEDVLVGSVSGQPCVIPLPAEVARAWSALRSAGSGPLARFEARMGRDLDAGRWTRELAAGGAIGWRAGPVRRATRSRA